MSLTSTEAAAQNFLLFFLKDLLCDIQVSTGRCGVEGDPALVVRLVDAGSVLHQESHHVHVVVDACLKSKKEGG